MHNKKLIIYGSIAAGTLIVILSLMFLFLFNAKDKEIEAGKEIDRQIFKAVPSDAVMVCDFNDNGDFISSLSDTAAFGTFFGNSHNRMMNIQDDLRKNANFKDARTVFSLHYSSKNKVSFLQITDISQTPGDNKIIFDIVDKNKCATRKYNNTAIYNIADSICFSLYDNLLLISNSPYVLESSIRHLVKKVSILDNSEFSAIVTENDNGGTIYLRHSQIGKIFSGIIGRSFWKYSDFFAKLSSWSIFNADPSNDKLAFKGLFYNADGDSKQSSVYKNIAPQKTDAQKIIPANTLLSVILPLDERKQYLKSYTKFLGANKRLNSYETKLNALKGKNQYGPAEWADSLNIIEIATMYTPIHGAYEWINAIKCKSQFSLSKTVSKVFKKEIAQIEKFPYKGYAAGLFGDIFGLCNEEYFIQKGSWIIIGSQSAMKQFIAEEQPFLNVEEYFDNADIADILNKECSARVLINLRGGQDTLKTNVIKSLKASNFVNGFTKRNFIFLSADLTSDKGDTYADINIVAKNIENPDIKRRLKEPIPVGGIGTKNVKMEKHEGPFELIDFTTSGKCYIKQMPNNALQFYDANMKPVWAIPFPSPICGRIEQADLFNNNKLQMIFITENKLYALDRKGRFVNNYPCILPKKVEFGPILIDKNKNKEYNLLVMNTDNTISLYDVKGNKAKNWTDINTPEPIYKMPEIKIINGKHYWIVKTSERIRIYNFNGKEIIAKKNNKFIDSESAIEITKGDEIKVKCTDGKQYIFNLANSEIKRAD